jgi:hypothetical protein
MRAPAAGVDDRRDEPTLTVRSPAREGRLEAHARVFSPPGLEAPPAKDIDAEMKAFLDWFNAEDDTDFVIRAGALPDTALRDVTDLVERGIPRRGEGGGRRTSYTLTEE